MQALRIPLNTSFTSNIPRNYDTHLGPLFSQPYAESIAQRVAAMAPKAVLELACGTGRLTRQLDTHLDSDTRIVATDVDPAMLRFAQQTLNDRAIEWDVVDAVELPFTDRSFDVVVAQFGVMFYSDRVRAFREAQRILRPGGTLVFATWNSLAENAVAEITQDVVNDFFRPDIPTFYQMPFAYHDQALIQEEVLSAGFQRVHLELLSLEGHAATAPAAARGLLEGSPLHTSIMDRDPFMLPAMRETLSARLAERFGSRNLSVPLSAWVVEAKKA